MRKFGIYGGTFDPIHHGHLLAAQAAMDELNLDRVIFIPAAVSPFKTHLGHPAASDEHRIRMLELALDGHPDMQISLREIRQGGVSYTIDTVRHLLSEFPGTDLFWIIGADQCDSLHKWKNADELRKLISFAAIPRPGIAGSDLPEGFSGQVLEGHLVNISSTVIRERIRSRRSIRWMLPEPVADFIERNNLYL